MAKRIVSRSTPIDRTPSPWQEGGSSSICLRPVRRPCQVEQEICKQHGHGFDQHAGGGGWAPGSAKYKRQDNGAPTSRDKPA